MVELDDLTLLFLYRMISKRCDDVFRSIRRCQGFIDRGVDRYESMALYESEYVLLSNLKEKICNEIALRSFTKDF